MCPHEGRLQPGSLQGPADNRTDGTRVSKTTMRRLVPDEHAPCRARRTMLAQVGSHCFADISGKRKSVVIASLPMYCQHAGSPVDIVEFQGDDFAGSQPQPGQEKKDRAITTSNGRVSSVASMDNSFDLFGREILRDFSEPPRRYCRNGPCKVTCGFSMLEEKPKEGSQRRHHQLGFSWTARAGVSQEETRDILRDQLPNTNGCVPEAFSDETPNESPIPGRCHRRKRAFLFEEVLISLLKPCQR